MVTIFLANGFEETEAVAPIDMLRRAGIAVQTAAVGGAGAHGGKVITSAHGIPMACDVTEQEVTAEGMEMLILPGGLNGTKNLENSPIVQKWLDYAAQNDLWIAAICAAPSVLGHKGLLNGKNATCYPGFEEALTGAKVGGYVVQDGKFVTAKGAGVSIEFGLKLVECLQGEQSAQTVRESIQCKK